jgi:NAD(P)-dependent dehydrogenase (short-subunit alcohol dehydrogenase family)
MATIITTKRAHYLTIDQTGDQAMPKTWFITGVSSGLGRIMTEKLLDRGDRVVGTARRTDLLSDLAAAHSDRFHITSLDLTDRAAIRTAIDEAFAHCGHIDVVVSNAGYGLFGAAEELGDEQIDRQIATNLTGSIQLIRASLPHLRSQDGGRIVQVSSEGGQIAYPSFSLYHASKWGIEGFVEAVAQEVAPFGIDFVIAEPGPTGTNFGAALDLAKPSDTYEGTPAADVRRAIASGEFAIRGDAARTVDAIIAAADADQPPFRLVLGSTAYENIHTALTKRLEALEAQREVAVSADRKEI